MRAAWAMTLLVPILAAGCGSGGDHRSANGDHGSGAAAKAPAAPPRRFRLEAVGRFNQPVYVTQPVGETHRLFVVEKTGRVRVVRGGKVLHAPFLSVRGRTSQLTEQGLLGLAFAPDYERSRRLYYSYTDRWGNLRVVRAEASRRHPDRISLSSRRLVLLIPKPAATHNGGALVFGPDDLLYIGVGDGGGPGDPHRYGENRGTLLGKILRIDPRRTRHRRYRVPSSNPFVDLRGARDEIYAFGLRNPWRFSFDSVTGGLYIGDVGQERWEEIDAVSRRRAKGANFGWSAYEGYSRYNRRVKARGRVVEPIHVYGRREGCAVIGGYVVRDPGLRKLWGRYLYGDFCNGEIRSLRAAGRKARDVRSEHVVVPGMSSFGEDSAGRLYVTSLTGPVYRLAPVTAADSSAHPTTAPRAATARPVSRARAAARPRRRGVRPR
jgi:glucose/arabinose dehydrogenase